MLVPFIIFIAALLVAFGMLVFRAWELRTERIKVPGVVEETLPDLSFRHVEKSMLYLTKHLVQGIVLWVVKHWFILITKTKKFIADKWPKFYAKFQKKPEATDVNKKPSFFKKAILESEAKIKRIKEKVKREHE